jgi:hypothetical protein
VVTRSALHDVVSTCLESGTHPGSPTLSLPALWWRGRTSRCAPSPAGG